MAGMSVDHPGSRYVHAEIFILRIKQRSTLCIEYLLFCQEWHKALEKETLLIY